MRRNLSAILIIVAVVAILIIGLLGRVPLQWRWLGMIATFVGLLAFLGYEVTSVLAPGEMVDGQLQPDRVKPGRIDGVLIDSRNKISLARLQSALWTVIVISAWATFALHRVIPVVGGLLRASDAPILQEVAKLVAAPQQPGEAETRRAAAMLEQITGAEVIIAEGDEAAAADRRGYDALAINIPREVWLALGISIASLTGAGIIKTNQANNDIGNKREVAQTRLENATSRATVMDGKVAELKDKRDDTLESMRPRRVTEAVDAPLVPPSQAELDQANKELAQVKAQLKTAQDTAERAKVRAGELQAAQNTAVGELHAYTTSAEARWSDMLRGDTLANFQFIDLGKVQMFFLTVILVFSYAALIWAIMAMPLSAQVLQLTPSMSLPAFSDSLVILMGLSHSGYLAAKATV